MGDVLVKMRLIEGGKKPEYKTVGSSGCDVYSRIYEDIVPNSWKMIPTGIFLEFPSSFECQVRSRSGLAMNHGVFVLNSPGTIDSDYRGEVSVILFNASRTTFEVCPGDRIAQLVFAPIARAAFACVENLSDTIRGEGGFGSTGR